VLIPCNRTVKESCTKLVYLVMLSQMHFHASCYAFHHAKECIIRLRVVICEWKGSCWPIFGWMLPFNGARVDQVLEKVHPLVVMISSLTQRSLWGTNLLCNAGKPRSIQPFSCIYKCFYNSSPMTCALSKIVICCIPNYCMAFLDISILFLVTLLVVIG
jgi:hypothetical protein